MWYFSELFHILVQVWTILLVLTAYLATCVVVVVIVGISISYVFKDGRVGFDASLSALIVYLIITAIVAANRYGIM